MEKNEKKEISAIRLGIKTGFYTLVWNWVCLIIPSMAVQILGFEHESMTYELVMVIFKILAGVYGVKLALDASLSASRIKSEDITKSAIVSTITISILAFLLVIVLPFMPIAPFNNLFGVLIMIIVYYFSNMYFRKKYE